MSARALLMKVAIVPILFFFFFYYKRWLTEVLHAGALCQRLTGEFA